MPDWLGRSAVPMIIESGNRCDDGTSLTALVTRTQATLVLDGGRRIVLPALTEEDFSDGSNRFTILRRGLSRIALSGRAPTTCNAVPPEPLVAEQGPTTDPDTFWADPPGPPMIIASDHVCDDGTNVTTLVSRVESTLILNGQRRIRLPLVGPRSYSDGSNHFRRETYGLIRIELAGRPPITCSPAPPAEPR